MGGEKDPKTQKWNEQRRITPAWAGKSSSLCLCILLFWDHPRMGGEKVSAENRQNHTERDHPRMGGEKVPQRRFADR